MADETKNYNLKFTLDDSQFQSKAKNVAIGVTGINQALELLQKTYRSIASAADFAGKSIERGADVSDVEESFDRLANKAGTTAEVLKKDLNDAALNTVSNFDLMRKANEQLRAGLKPDELVAVSKAAKQFADQDGKDFIETMDQMAKSLIRGDDRALKNLGVIVDNKKAYADFAKEIGTTAEKLNELGKAQAIREAAAKELTKRTEEMGKASKDAGDKVKELQKAFKDAWDQELKSIAANKETLEALDKLIILAPKVAKGILDIAGAFGQLFTEVYNFNTNFGRGALQLSNYWDVLKAGVPLHMAWDIAMGLTVKQLQMFQKETKESATSVKTLSMLVHDLSKFSGEAAAPVDDLTRFTGDAGEAAAAAAKKYEELKKSIAEMGRDATGESLGSAIEESIESLNYSSFDNLKQQILANARAGLMEGIKDALGTPLEAEARAGVETSLNNIAIELNDKMIDAGADAFKAMEEQQKEALQNSVDFFDEIFSQVIEDGSIDFEAMLKQVAVGFASTLAAGLLNIQMPGGGLGGLGSALASSILGGGGGGGTGSLLGGLGLGAGIGSLGMSGTAAYGAGLSGPLTASGAFTPGSGLLGFAAANPYLVAGGAALAIGSQTNWFGLGGGMSGGQKERAGVRDKISGMAGGGDLSTQYGSRDLFGIDFKQFDESVPILEDARKAVEGLTLALTDGGEQSDEFAQIFAQLVTGFEDGTAKAANQNDILFATKEIMAQLGMTTDEAKGQLLALFKEGTISTEQFSDGIASLNELAREDLIGDGSIADAVKILAESIEKDPGAALKAFELAFKEAAEVAGNQLGTVQDFFVQVFGQDAIAVFDQLKAAGISTWQDIANASVDQIAIIFQALTSLGIQADQVMAGIASATVNPQGGAPVPGAASTPAPSSGSGGGGGGGTRGETEAQKRAKKNKELAKERLKNKKLFDSLFGDISGSLGGTGGLDDALLGLLGGGSQFSMSHISQVLNSSDFLGLGAGAGQFGQNLLTGLAGRTGTALAPLSTEVGIDEVLSSLNRAIPAERTFGPAAQLISRVRAELQGRAFRGQETISIADVQGLFSSNQGGLIEGFTGLFGAQEGQQAAGNLSSFTGDVIGDLRRSAGSEFIDIEGLREAMTEAEEITRESFIKPLEDAKGAMMELFENSSKRGVKRFLEETNQAIKRLKDIRTELQTTSERADGLLGKLGQVGVNTRSRKNTSVNNLNAAA